jgi:hypothetical protein
VVESEGRRRRLSRCSVLGKPQRADADAASIAPTDRQAAVLRLGSAIGN